MIWREFVVWRHEFANFFEIFQHEFANFSLPCEGRFIFLKLNEKLKFFLSPGLCTADEILRIRGWKIKLLHAINIMILFT